ncbi:MAG: FAD-dependent oxidoreductase [candidate division WOR-3 bacterium]
MERNNNKLISAIISIFIVGGGQIYSKRILTGIMFIIFFYGSILVTKILWIKLTIGFWLLLGSWILFWLFNIYDAYRGETFYAPPCEKNCPAGIAPWYYINLIVSNKNKYPFVPFFKILGMICPAPCEDNCTRRGIDEPIAIGYLKHAVETEEPSAPIKKRKEKIAIIGAGPCGLTAAYELGRKGYQVLVFEKEKYPGGVLSMYIPEFRLPRAIVDEEIELLKKAGFEIKTNIEVGKDINLAELITEYNAIFISTGAGKSEKLHIEGEESALGGLDVLYRIKNGEAIKLGKVAVIGGGNTAFDVARSLLRCGNDVAIYYRRGIEDMPAEKENKIEAEEEGIKIYPYTTPVRIKNNKVVMAKTRAPEGRKGRVEIVANSEFEIEVDKVVSAIGQVPSTDFLSDYINLDDRCRIITKNGRAGNSKIFAGGDAVRGPQTLAHAVGDGLRIARMIDKYLNGGLFGQMTGLMPSNPVYWQVLSIPRIKIPHRPVAERIKDFKLVEQTPSKEDLKNEAKRCLVCPLRYRP